MRLVSPFKSHINLITQPAYVTFLTNQKAIFKLCKTFVTTLSDQQKLISVAIESGISRGLSRAISRWLISFRQL